MIVPSLTVFILDGWDKWIFCFSVLDFDIVQNNILIRVRNKANFVHWFKTWRPEFYSHFKI